MSATSSVTLHARANATQRRGGNERKGAGELICRCCCVQSSAHVYLRMQEGMSIKEIPTRQCSTRPVLRARRHCCHASAHLSRSFVCVLSSAVLIDCAQLVKANSIEGNKKTTGKVRIVYTLWANLHKTRGMADGSVEFKKDKDCCYTEVIARENAIVNRLEKTRLEKSTSFIKQSREEYEAIVRGREKEAKRAAVAAAQAEKEKFAQEKQAKSYDELFKPENMTSNVEHAASASNLDDDFM